LNAVLEWLLREPEYIVKHNALKLKRAENQGNGSWSMTISKIGWKIQKSFFGALVAVNPPGVNPLLTNFSWSREINSNVTFS
jgi:hypothetical protein